MKKRMLACAVLAVAGLAASEAPAQETLKVQPTPVIRSEGPVRNGPIRRILGRRDVVAPAGETTMRVETTTKVEPTPPITPVQVQPQAFESRRDGPLARLRGRLGRF